jgi:hypothetical protein
MLHFAVLSGTAVDTVDVFNVNSGTWTTATLSVAAMNLAATSLPDYGLAMFAGGSSVKCFVVLILSRRCQILCCTHDQHVLRSSDGNSYSPVVEIFNASSGTWTTAQLSAARSFIAASSLSNIGIAMFAGGSSACNVTIF